MVKVKVKVTLAIAPLMRQPHHRSAQVWHALSRRITCKPTRYLPCLYLPTRKGWKGELVVGLGTTAVKKQSSRDCYAAMLLLLLMMMMVT